MSAGEIAPVHQPKVIHFEKKSDRACVFVITDSSLRTSRYQTPNYMFVAHKTISSVVK